MAITRVTSGVITDGTIANADLADDAVGVAELSATGTASSSTFLRGDNSWAAAGGDNTPAFMVGTANDTNITGIASDTYTKVAFGTEVYDTDTAYNTTNYRFTVPSGEGGTYIFYWNLEMVTSNDAQGKLLEDMTVLYKNGSTAVQDASGTAQYHRNSNSRREVMAGTHTQVLSASDYIELYVSIVAASGGTGTLSFRSWFGGHKLLL